MIQKDSDQSTINPAQQENQLNVNSKNEELIKKDDIINKDMPFIESINLVSLHHIQGTENYKFKIKVGLFIIIYFIFLNFIMFITLKGKMVG